MKKKTIAVVFGGQSSEHEISCISASTVIDHINTEHYDILLIGITKEGHWLLVNSSADLKSGEWVHSDTEAVISPDGTKKCVMITKNKKTTEQPVDLVFPTLHGLYGEDGTIQGVLELAHIPYVGCGVLASAAAMDKLTTKIIADSLGIRQAEYVAVLRSQLNDLKAVAERVEKKLAYPVFVKPSNAGSSRGVSKAADRDELFAALKEAGRHDRRILVEEMIIGREVECAVLGSSDVRASGVGEIIAAADFYDYDAKYNNEASATIMDPDIPAAAVKAIREASVQIFKAIDGYGLSRVDFFVEKDTNEVIFNEINTFPGFTSISMYSMLWEHKGISKATLIEKLIQTAFARSGEQEVL